MTADPDKPTVRYSFPRPEEKLAFTGERFVSGLTGPIQHEHHHRYLFAAPLCVGKTVLDIASGEGYGCQLLSQVASTVVGVDNDPEAVRYASEQYASERLRFLVGDATAIPLTSASVDVVTSFETIEHFQDHERFLHEVSRVLRPGGLLVISSPNRVIYSELSGHVNEFHVRELDREEFRSELQAQFANVEVFEQRSLYGSAIVAERGKPARVSGLNSADGLNYDSYGGLPNVPYFVAVASSGPLPDIANSLMSDGSYIGNLHNEIASLNSQTRVSGAGVEDLRAQVTRKQAEIERTSDHLRHAESQVRALRAALEQWRQESQAPKQQSLPQKQPHSRWGILGANPVARKLRSVLRRVRVRRARAAFDAAFYLAQNPDVASAGIDPFEHYLLTGWHEGRDPSAVFSTRYYLEQHPDVRASGINPLLHYVVRGRIEGRRAHPQHAEPQPKRKTFSPAVPQFVPITTAEPLATKPARVIAFYLPQFHAIPENNKWWGEGFTEWTNVRAAKPHFEGHYQPHVPIDTGYYDLLDPKVQQRQIELAKLYGIGGFCFYFYWFGGKRLLEKPLENWLNDKSLNLPFCVCWANENWTRRWDGLDAEVLIAQRHSPEDDLAFIEEVAPFLRDERYIRVDGKPLLIVYRPSLLPSSKETAARWRQWCRDNGIGEIYLAYTQSFEHVDPRNYGFDAAIEFPPNRSRPPDLTNAVTPLDRDFSMKVYDWSVLNERSARYEQSKYTLYRSVCPSWDNTARRKNAGTVFVNNSPELYREWLSRAIADTASRFEEPDQRLVFVNAWNEWAEGAHLEPDASYGYAWLQATRDALEGQAVRRTDRRRIVIVSHDAHPHGAQLLAMNMARTFGEMGFDTDMIVLGDGPLLPRFAEVAKVHRIDLRAESGSAVLDQLRALHAGAEVAIANTTVSGLLVPLLKQAGFRVVSLVHELPGVLRTYKLTEHARAISDHADKIVFAAQVVRDGFEEVVGRGLEQAEIRPQGLYNRTNLGSQSARSELRSAVRNKLGLPAGSRLVLGVGYGDHRKGLDLFVDMSLTLLERDHEAVAVWVGHLDGRFGDAQKRRVRAAGLTDRIVFTGLVNEPQEFFQAADVYALTSREDPFPSVVLEAMDAGLPVVAFEGAGGFGDLLRRGCGIAVPAFDTSAMASGIEDLLNRPDHAAQMGRNGREIIEHEFHVRDYAYDLLKFAGRPLPRISVVVPNYNYARYLRDRLASITGQSVLPYELIVLDDASSDESVEVIRDFLHQLPIPSTLVVNDDNSGSVFKQWQRGVELARGDFVWIAEADDLADADFLAELLPKFADPNVVLAFCQSRQMGDKGEILSDHYLDYVADIDSSRWTKAYTVGGDEEIATALHVKNTIPNVSAVVFRREVLQAVLSEYGEEIRSFRFAGDWVAYLRVLERGSIAFSPRSLNSHRRHASSVTVGNFNARQLQEIIRVQREVVQRHALGEAAAQRAEAYADRLYHQFGLATPDRPRLQDNPEFKAY